MPKASSKRPKKKREDEAQAAVRVMNTIAEKSEETVEITDEMRKAAAAFGRIGGKIGGVKRAQSLSPSQRSQIAKAAARARWKKKGPDQ